MLKNSEKKSDGPGHPGWGGIQKEIKK